jgi:hypothetical protein
MFRSLVLTAVAAVTFSACGADLASRVVIGNDATLTKKGSVWYLAAPVQVVLPPEQAGWRITSEVVELSSTGFLSSSPFTLHELPADATSFERPLNTSSDLKRGVPVTIKLMVATHVWDGTIDVASSTDSRTFEFMLR